MIDSTLKDRLVRAALPAFDDYASRATIALAGGAVASNKIGTAEPVERVVDAIFAELEAAGFKITPALTQAAIAASPVVRIRHVEVFSHNGVALGEVRDLPDVVVCDLVEIDDLVRLSIAPPAPRR